VNCSLRHLDFLVPPGATAPSAQFWSNCFAHPLHLQRLGFYGITMPKVPKLDDAC
jgi:hypothetical protein